MILVWVLFVVVSIKPTTAKNCDSKDFTISWTVWNYIQRRGMSYQTCSITKLTTELVSQLFPPRQDQQTYFFELVIHGANLETVDEDAFKSNPYFWRISLYDNQIQSIPSNTFRGLLSLERLEIGKNRLKSIHPKWFQDLRNLTELHLQENFISCFSFKICQMLPKLTHLVLFLNDLSYINSNEVKEYCTNNKSITLFLHNNPLECAVFQALDQQKIINFDYGEPSLEGNKKIKEKYSGDKSLNCVDNNSNATSKNICKNGDWSDVSDITTNQVPTSTPGDANKMNKTVQMDHNTLITVSSIIILLNGVAMIYLATVAYQNGVFK